MSKAQLWDTARAHQKTLDLAIVKAVKRNHSITKDELDGLTDKSREDNLGFNQGRLNVVVRNVCDEISRRIRES